MTPIWWALETEIVRRVTEKEHLRTVSLIKGGAKVAKDLLVNVLGLNLIPEEDEETGRLKLPSPDNYTPMSVLVARPDVVSAAFKKIEEFEAQIKAGLEGPAVDAPVEEDLMLLDDLDDAFNMGTDDKEVIWESEENKQLLRQLITTGEPPSPDEVFVEDKGNKTTGNPRKQPNIQLD